MATRAARFSPANTRPANVILTAAAATAAVIVLAWQGAQLGELGQPGSNAPAHQRELAALPGRPEAPPSAVPSLDPLTALSRNAATPFVARPVTPAQPFRFIGSDHDRAQATECLALTALAEAGGSEAGQRAVIQIVLNRVRHPAFPKTVCGVVFQGAERTTGCQFTYTCDGSLTRSYPLAAWQIARRRARDALDGRVFRPVGLATHYHTTWVYPYWSSSLDKLAQVETQLFFNWRGFWGTPAALRAAYRGGEPSFAALLNRAITAAPLAARPLEVDHSDNAEIAKVGTLAGGQQAGEVVIPHPEGGSFLVGLKTGTGPASALALARRLCGGNGYCRVLAWSDRTALPRSYPIPPQARGRVSLSYVLDDQNVEAVEYDCQTFAAAPPGQCRGRAADKPVTQS